MLKVHPKRLISIDDDESLSSLMDSAASPKVKIAEGKKVGLRSLARSTSRVDGHTGAPR